jgi:hypothetical protein
VNHGVSKLNDRLVLLVDLIVDVSDATFFKTPVELVNSLVDF